MEGSSTQHRWEAILLDSFIPNARISAPQDHVTSGLSRETGAKNVHSFTALTRARFIAFGAVISHSIICDNPLQWKKGDLEGVAPSPKAQISAKNRMIRKNCARSYLFELCAIRRLYNHAWCK